MPTPSTFKERVHKKDELWNQIKAKHKEGTDLYRKFYDVRDEIDNAADSEKRDTYAPLKLLYLDMGPWKKKHGWFALVKEVEETIQAVNAHAPATNFDTEMKAAQAKYKELTKSVKALSDKIEESKTKFKEIQK